ncbi:MAG TPA: hypothetical protein VIP11_21945, partial [Gemmatimonadaceae bacterium]
MSARAVVFAAAVAIAPRAAASQAQPITVASPDKNLVVRVTIDAAGELRYVVARGGRDVLRPSRLGVVR